MGFNQSYEKINGSKSIRSFPMIEFKRMKSENSNP